MDNTTNPQDATKAPVQGQTPPASLQTPVPQAPQPFPATAQPVFTVQSMDSSQQQGQDMQAAQQPDMGVVPNQPAAPFQPVPQAPVEPPQQSFPQQPVSSVSQTDQVPTDKKITLDDLYGPSGLAHNEQNSPGSVPLSQPLSTVADQQPGQPTVQSVQQPLTQPQEPAQQIHSQNENVLPTEQQVPQTQVNPENPPSQTASVPLSNPVPDLPTVGQKAAEAAPLQEDSPLTVPLDMPLRKSAAMPQQVSVDTPPQPSDSGEKKPPKEKKSGVNKFILFRILFGGMGVIIFIILLMFVVTFLSSILHPAQSGKVTLTYWGLWEDSTTMQAAISAFEQQHPNIVVQYEKEDPTKYSERLLTYIQQGNGPDIFTYHSSWLPMVQSSLVPLPTSVISKDDLQKNFYPVVETDLVKNGAVYGIPLGIDTLSLFVNNALFKSAKAEVPTTWDSFTSTARALTQKDETGKIKVAGAAIGTFANITHAPDILSMLFAQNGVDIPTLSPKNNVIDALTFYTSFANGDSKVWDSTLDPSQLAFVKGNLAMYFGYSWDIFAIKAANPSLDFSVYPVPHLPGRNITAASYWVEGVSAKSTHQKEAFAFMQFLTQKNTEAMLYAEEAKTRLFGEPYARSDLGETLKGNSLVYPFVSQAKDAESSFFAGETQDTGLNGQMNQYLGNAVTSILPPNNVSADTAFDTMLQGVQQIENQYGSK